MLYIESENELKFYNLEARTPYHMSLNLSTLHGYVKCCGTGPCSAVGNVSGYRCEADCRSRGREFDPGPVPYFRGD